MSAAIYKYSFDEKRIKRYLLWEKMRDNNFINLKKKSEIGSYFSAIDKNILVPYNGKNEIWIRINPYISQLVKSYIEYRQGGNK
jgi:hypothetical protein